jgi:hypothetical protein
VASSHSFVSTKAPDRFSGKKGFAPPGRVGKDVEALFNVTVKADGHRRRLVQMLSCAGSIANSWGPARSGIDGWRFHAVLESGPLDDGGRHPGDDSPLRPNRMVTEHEVARLRGIDIDQRAR